MLDDADPDVVVTKSGVAKGFPREQIEAIDRSIADLEAELGRL